MSSIHTLPSATLRPFGLGVADPNVVIKAILAEPAFRQAVRTTSVAPPKSWWELLLEWLGHWLAPLWRPIERVLSAGQGVGTVVGFVLIALVLAALAVLVFRLASLIIAPALARRGGAVGSSRPLEVEQSPETWRRRAGEFAARGDYRRGIAALFAAALAVLDARDVVRFDAARTPGEYRRLVRRARCAAAPPFDELTERFVHATYAPAAPQAADFETAARAEAGLEPLLS